MLTILTACGGREMVKHVKACCQDENPKVVSEAARCLLEYGDEFGVEIVMQLLNSHSTEHVNHAVSLIGTYQINEAVPVLIGLLEKQEITRTDYLDKIPVVKALGEIGDPKSIEALRNLASSKSILFKSTVERLKEEIFKTLKYYPIDHVLDIAQGGTRSKNSVIRNESLQLVKRASQENMERRQSHGVI
jgi:HEAT repeat protein